MNFSPPCTQGGGGGGCVSGEALPVETYPPLRAGRGNHSTELTWFRAITHLPRTLRNRRVLIPS